MSSLYPQPSINLGGIGSAAASFQNDISVAGFTGGNSTAIVEFLAAGTAVGASITETLSIAVNGGSEYNLVRPGVYTVDVFVSSIGAVSIGVGIAVDLAGVITADPTWATVGVVADADPVTTAAATVIPVHLSATVTCTPAQAAAGRTVQFLCTDSAAGAPVGVLAADFAIRIVQVADLFG